MQYGEMVYLTEGSLEWALKDSEPGSLHIDLAPVVFVRPVGLVVLAALLDCAGTQGWPVTLVPPGNQNAASYLSRMGLGDIADEAGCSHGLPTVAKRDPQDRFVELRRFGANDPADGLIDMIEARLDEWGDDGILKGMLYDNFYELALNVEEHAMRPGFLSAQYYPQKNRVAFAVADWGIGIRASLSSAGHVYATAEEAVMAAANTRVSKKPVGGAGLPSIVKNILQWKGHVRIRSSGVRLRFAAGSEPRIGEQVSHLPGTVVSVEFPSYARKQ